MALVGLTLVVFARGLRGPAVAVTVVDDAVVGWLAGLVGPGLVGPLRGVARIGSWWVLFTLMYGLVLVLLVLRRWRHLIVWLVVSALASYLIVGLAVIARRPRPFGVDLRSSWGGWALPSMQVAFLTMSLMTVLYTLVPEGRWRNLGKWLLAGLVTLVALARMALGVDAPSDVLVGVGIGVTIPLLLFRRFTPNEVYPVAYRRGRAAHLDIGGARGQAIRRALEDQLGLVVEEVKPFGLSGSAGSTPMRITVKGDPPRQLFGKLYAQSHLRSDRWYKLGRELLYGRLEDEKPFKQRTAAGAAGGLRPAAVPGRGAAQPDPVRVCRADARSGVPAGHRVLRRHRRAGRGGGHRPGGRRRAAHHSPAVGCWAGPS
ncbi:MAG TPA: phosphatase PAP2 family protein [Actinomycetes bacterium]|nr:phosphatase PAP2 family protein [Actinomycetes bacterium]